MKVELTPIQWLVLDNLKHNWPYDTNICGYHKEDAIEAYSWCARNCYLKDGKITPDGEMVLMVGRVRGVSK